MSEFAPVLTVEDLDALDTPDVIAGYFSATGPDDPEPGNNHTRSYWHGWQCGMADRYRRPMNDPEGHRRLVHMAITRPGGLLGAKKTA